MDSTNISYTGTTTSAEGKEIKIVLEDKDFMLYQMLKDIKEMLTKLSRK